MAQPPAVPEQMAQPPAVPEHRHPDGNSTTLLAPRPQRLPEVLPPPASNEADDVDEVQEGKAKAPNEVPAADGMAELAHQRKEGVHHLQAALLALHLGEFQTADTPNQKNEKQNNHKPENTNWF